MVRLGTVTSLLDGQRYGEFLSNIFFTRGGDRDVVPF